MGSASTTVAPGRTARARCLAAGGDLPAAKAVALAPVQETPDNPEALLAAAELLWEVGLRKDALGLVPIALNLKPGDIGSYYMVKGYETALRISNDVAHA